MKNKYLADLLFPEVDKTPEDYEKIYPKRDLKDGAIVTRYAPSPTGFIHMGALLSSFVGSTFAHQTNGVFYLRIEDTDTKRTVENGVNLIINGLKEFGVTFDEGPINETEEKGSYGPYVQSDRELIYKSFAKRLVEQGKAYPCFCSEEDIEKTREFQTATKKRIGYYGSYAKCRHLTEDEAIEKIKNGEKPVIRLRSEGNFDNKIICHDEIRGDLEFPENDLDIVIIKSDGLPTYHFAHAIDDHLMRSTHIIRGDEWLSSFPIHVQLFDTLGFERVKYCHIAPLCKVDEETGGVRKLSKRKDPEAAMSYYHGQGIPFEAVMLYLATLASSSFDEWLINNPDKMPDSFTFEFDKMSKTGALIDIEKLNNICRNFISKLSKDELYDRCVKYFNEYDKEFNDIFTKDEKYTKSILNIERETLKPRKDIAKYSDVKDNVSYMYNELFNPNYENKGLNKEMYLDYIENYFDENQTNEEWFNNVSECARKYNYVSMKEYKLSPDSFAGHVGSFCEGLRYIVTGRTKTPNLQDILNILGKENLLNRIKKY